jgi:hypothetical protein
MKFMPGTLSSENIV